MKSFISLIITSCLLVSGCGGGETTDSPNDVIPPITPPPTPAPTNSMHSVGGNVSGLGNSELVINSNLGDEISINSDGEFIFPTKFSNGANFEVSIISQPATLSCTAQNATGQVSNQDFTDISILCVEQATENTYSVSGSVSGIGNSELLIRSNLGDVINIGSDGGFTFPTKFSNGENFEVNIVEQAETLNCEAENARGQISDEDVTNVFILCEEQAIENMYSVSVNVSGLGSTEMIIGSNLGDEISIESDGSFTFPTQYSNGQDFEVAILRQPQALRCETENASGQILNQDINDATISCEEQAHDIVYVRYPNETEEDQFVNIPQGEHAYDIAAGADLMLLKGDGSEIVLVDCEQCSVMDPFISFDGKTVYYSLIEEPNVESASWIYKINLSEGDYSPIRLTFDDGFDSLLYADNTSPAHDQSSFRGIRDMAPSPLADGRIVFTSNRSALATFRPGTDAAVKGSVQQLYVLDDHDGSATTKELSNLHLLETGNLHMVQHPFQLKDGRILFSTWQDAGTKFSYAMTTLFTIYPDGTNLQQFTEPHDHNKVVDHFATQLTDESIIAGYYYPSFDYGFGILMQYPIGAEGPDFLRGNVDQKYPWGNQLNISRREFDRKGTKSITPHTTSGDMPAPDLSGKYSMPSATVNDDLLVAYSSGSVNHFDAVCNQAVNLCEPLRSGIYLIQNATAAMVESPASLVLIKDDPNYNEIWPRVVASYYDIHGQEKPNIIQKQALDNRLEQGEAAGLVGSSSMMNREPLNESNPDPFKPSDRREINDGNWRIEGAEAGIVNDDDIYAVRIIVSPPKPFTKPVRKYGDRDDWESIKRYLADTRLDNVVARYGSMHGERWEILGEFPLTHMDVTDAQGNPDTSWVAKVPADTPFFIQTLDANGMTVISELTWRGLKSGEERTDCGGCHAHSVEPLEFGETQAGLRQPITNIANLDLSDPIVQEGIWDLTQGTVPLVSERGVEKVAGYSVGVEFNRDVLPIINTNCVSCHTADGAGSSMILDGTNNTIDAYNVLTKDPEGTYEMPQISKYIRIPQARQSLLTWVVWGERLDGRNNSERDNDVDYPENHPALALTDLEKRTIARWIDLGAPIDFPALNMAGQDGFRYTDDYQLPVINIHSPAIGANTETTAIIGFADAMSGINWESIVLSVYPVDNAANSISIDEFTKSEKSVVTFNLPTLPTDKNYVLKAEIADLAGNKNIQTVNFRLEN